MNKHIVIGIAVLIIIIAILVISYSVFGEKQKITILKSDGGYYLVLNDNSDITTTKDKTSATPVSLEKVKTGNFTHYAIKTGDGSKYICIYGVSKSFARKIIYKDSMSFSQNSIDNPATILLTSIYGMTPIVSLLTQNGGNYILDPMAYRILYDQLPGELYVYGIPRNSDNKAQLESSNVHSWTPIPV